MPFDPNAPVDPDKKAKFDWSTYVPWRLPKYKVHRNSGAAKNAINCHAVTFDRRINGTFNGYKIRIQALRKVDHVVGHECCQIFKYCPEQGKWVEIKYELVDPKKSDKLVFHDGGK